MAYFEHDFETEDQAHTIKNQIGYPFIMVTVMPYGTGIVWPVKDDQDFHGGVQVAFNGPFQRLFITSEKTLEPA